MSNRLYVGNLPYTFTSTDLQQVFSEYGTVVSANVITDRETGRSRGFGFVEMDSTEAFQNALEGANGRDVGGRQLSVTEARERAPREGGGGGGFGGRPGGPRPQGGGFGGPRGGPRPGGPRERGGAPGFDRERGGWGGGGGGGGGGSDRGGSDRGGSDRGGWGRDEGRRGKGGSNKGGKGRDRFDKRRDEVEDRSRRQRFRDFPDDEDFG